MSDEHNKRITLKLAIVMFWQDPRILISGTSEDIKLINGLIVLMHTQGIGGQNFDFLLLSVGMISYFSFESVRLLKNTAELQYLIYILLDREIKNSHREVRHHFIRLNILVNTC